MSLFTRLQVISVKFKGKRYYAVRKRFLLYKPMYKVLKRNFGYNWFKYGEPGFSDCIVEDLQDAIIAYQEEFLEEEVVQIDDVMKSFLE